MPAPVTAPDNRSAVDRARAAELVLGLSRRGWSEVQHALNTLGHVAGPEDGLPGAWTRAALKAWQQVTGSDPNGYLDARQQMRLLRAAALEVIAAPSAPSSR